MSSGGIARRFGMGELTGRLKPALHRVDHVGIASAARRRSATPALPPVLRIPPEHAAPPPRLRSEAPMHGSHHPLRGLLCD